MYSHFLFIYLLCHNSQQRERAVRQARSCAPSRLPVTHVAEQQRKQRVKLLQQVHKNSPATAGFPQAPRASCV